MSQFIKTVSSEVLRLFSELRVEFDLFLNENNGINNNLNELKANFENITFEKLITKRIEIQNIINQKIKEKEKKFEQLNQQKMREKNLEDKRVDSNGGEEIAIVDKNNKFVFEENMENEPSRNKFKEFSISKKELYEGRLDNNLRSSRSRKPSSRAIESFNTVNRNSNNNLLQLTQGSVNDTPNSELNQSSSDFDAKNDKIYNHKYKFKYSNMTQKQVGDIKSNINNNDINENNSYQAKSKGKKYNLFLNDNIELLNNNKNIKKYEVELLNNKDKKNFDLDETKVNNKKKNKNTRVKKDESENNSKTSNINNKNSNNYELSNIDTQGNEDNRNQNRQKKNLINKSENAYNINNKELINNESEEFYHSPSFSNVDFRKGDNRNRIEFNKSNNYSFKNSINNSKNNFNQNSSSIKNYSFSNEKNEIDSKYQNKQSNSSFYKDKSSKKNSSKNSHKKLINNNKISRKKINFGNKNNNISFKDNSLDENINEDDNDDEEVMNINNYSLFSDEELQKIYQTLSDINEVNVENNNPNNYSTYPFEEKNDNINIVIKEVPLKVKKRISVYYRKIEKEREVRRISEKDNCPSLKDLEKKINQIRKEINIIDVNDYYNTKIAQLHFNEIDEDQEMNDKLYKMADELNKEFYGDIEQQLKSAKEKLNEIVI